MNNHLRRASRGQPCPICQHTSWCGVRFGSDGKPDLAVCMRVESRRTSRNGGWLHVLRSRSAPPVRTLGLPRHLPDFGPMLARLRQQSDPTLVANLAAMLGLPVAALQALDAVHYSWSNGRRSVSVLGIPMRDPRDGNRCVGISVRSWSGKKWAENGSAWGLMLPTAPLRTDPIFLVEGATDCAAILGIGLSAVGRPSALASDEIVAMLRRIISGRRAVVVGENDAKPDGTWPGKEGADRLAEALVLHAREVRILYPPANVKDARAWIFSGATRDDLLRAAAAARVIGPEDYVGGKS